MEVKFRQPHSGKVVSRITDFAYVVQRQEKGKVCFGSGLERKLLELDKNGLVSKHARSNLRETFDNVGPGSYDIDPQTSALSKVLNKPTSTRGTVLGGRRAPRVPETDYRMLTPGPIYDIPTTFPTTFKQSCAPFNVSQGRTDMKILDYPGVGIYTVATYKRRRIAFAHSFGGPKCLIPAVKMKCDPFNFDTCERCGKFPEGDYWSMVIIENAPYAKKAKQMKSIFLCRPCYELEKKDSKLFSKGQLKNFHKMRDCSTVHFHGGCKARILLVSPRETAKLKEREGYFSLYFS